MVANTFQVLSGSLLDVTSRLRFRVPAAQTAVEGSGPDRSFAGFENQLHGYLHDTQVQLVKRAYFFAEQAHYGQVRRSGSIRAPSTCPP